MKKQNRSSKTLDSAPELSSSPCDMARFTDYFFGLDKKHRKRIETKQPMKPQGESD
ncbi:hypothetical protein AB6T38_14845 [Aliiglaciecola sp. SL4]|uniref:hypothetical protein n=1 Tax=Aliiglaciecola sp. SL4 TaxID=3239806 RepID=UPI00355C4E49